MNVKKIKLCTSDTSMFKQKGAICKTIGYHLVYEKKNQLLMFSVHWKIPTRESTVPVGNSASLVSHWNSGHSGWDFPVPTEHQC